MIQRMMYDYYSMFKGYVARYAGNGNGNRFGKEARGIRVRNRVVPLSMEMQLELGIPGS